MGQKIHPVGFRVGVNRDWESKWYLDKGYAKALVEDFHIRDFIKKRKELANASIARVEIERAANRVKVTCIPPSPASSSGAAARVWTICGRSGRQVQEVVPGERHRDPSSGT